MGCSPRAAHGASRPRIQRHLTRQPSGYHPGVDAEAVTMWFIATVVIIVTALGGPHDLVVDWVYRVSAIVLLAIAALTAATGARTPVVFFKICPFLLSVTAALLLAASWV